MASRKRKESPQLGFNLPTSLAVPPTASSASVDSSQAEAAPIEIVDLEEYDDYDDHSGDAPKLRLVDPPAPMPRVIVELVGSGPKGDTFEVSRLRSNGNTVASVMWTRDELQELIERASAALKLEGT